MENNLNKEKYQVITISKTPKVTPAINGVKSIANKTLIAPCFMTELYLELFTNGHIKLRTETDTIEIIQGLRKSGYNMDKVGVNFKRFTVEMK